MAATWKQSITTSAGIALMNKAYGVSSIIPTKAVTITDDISGYSVTQVMALTSVNYNQSRVPIVISNQANTTRIGIDIDNKDVNEQYDYYGIGVYFKQVSTGEEVLFSVIPLTGAATIIPNQSGVATSSISIDSYTSIVPGTKVDLSVSDSGSVTRSDVEQIVAANQSYSFPKKPAASGIDFYTLKSVGIYQIKDDKTVVNSPDGFSGNGYIVVIGDGTTANPITQDLFDTVTGNKYSNSYDSDGNKWTGWEEMASMSDVTTTLNNGLSTKVTDNKNDTISVNGVNILPANENVIGRIDGIYTDMNDIPMGWWYLNGWADLSGLSNWGLPQAFYYIHCFKTNYGAHTIIQIAYDISKNNVYMRTMNSTTWNTWKLLADDSKVVHVSDMRKPASDVASIDEVNAKQDKLGYTPANDANMFHRSPDTGTVTESGNFPGLQVKGVNVATAADLNNYYHANASDDAALAAAKASTVSGIYWYEED